MKVIKYSNPSGTRYEIVGNIDENSDFTALMPEGAEMHVDCHDIARINSVGVSRWMKHFNAIRAQQIKFYFYRMSCALVEQLNAIKNFDCGGTIVSFMIPYQCDECKRIVLVEKSYLEGLQGNLDRIQQKCEGCGNMILNVDDDPEEYFFFLQEVRDTKKKADDLLKKTGQEKARRVDAALEQGKRAFGKKESAEIELDSQTRSVTKRTFIFYKPKGLVALKRAEMGVQTVMDYFLDIPHASPVGKMDAEAEGLLVMSEDEDLIMRYAHVGSGVERVYEVEWSGEMKEAAQHLIAGRVDLEDGPARFDDIQFTSPHSARVVATDGRVNFVRRMFLMFGLRVTKLKQVKMGDFELGNLKPGERKVVQV